MSTLTSPVSTASSPISPTAARIYGLSMIVAPLLLLASTVAFLTEGDGINDGVLGGTIGVWSSFALIVAFVGLLRLAEPVAPRAAPILSLVAVTGLAAGIGFNVQAIFTAHYGPEIDEFLDVVEGSDAIGILAFLPWGLLAPVALVSTGILLWRTRVVTRWSAGLLIAAGVLFVASRPERIGVLAVLSDCATVLALAPVGWSTLTTAPPKPAAMAPAPRSVYEEVP